MSTQVPIQTTRQVSLIVVPIVANVVAAVAVALRVVARRISHRSLDASEYVMFGALFFTTAFSGLLVAEPFVGVGLHMTEIVATYGMAPITAYLKMTIGNQVLWAISVCLPKISALLLYSKIFTTKPFILAAKVTGVLILLLGIATILGSLLQCQPFAYNWDQTIPGGHCGNQVLSYQITGGLNVTLDVITLLLPLPYLATLEMPIYQKLVLIATFAVGFLTCAISALRIVSIISMNYADLTYLAVVPSIYSVLEPTLAITLACVPMLRPLFGGHYSSRGTLLRRKGKSHTTTIGSESTGGHGFGKHSWGFQKVNDRGGISDGHDQGDSSQIELRPVGNEYKAQVSAQNIAGQLDQTADRQYKERVDEHVGGKIVVKTDWEIKET